MFVWLFTSQLLYAGENENTTGFKDPFDISFEELAKIKISSASLTKVDRKFAPASITYITQQDIVDSGARRLDELLDIMVPNLQLVRHNYGPTHVGIRGLITDRDNSYLYNRLIVGVGQ